MEKIVITGGAGFVRSHIVDTLIEQNFDVHIIDNYIQAKRDDRINKNAIYHEVDICNYDDIAPIISGASFVFHLAARPSVQYSVENPLETFNINAHGTCNVLEASRQGGVKRVIFSSTGAVYGDQKVMPFTEEMDLYPKSPYGLHKKMGEDMCRLWTKIYGVETVSLRYLNIYGPRFNLRGAYTTALGKFILQRQDGLPMTIFGDGSHTRDYTHVSDVVRANILAMESDNVGNAETINVGTGRSISVKELSEIIKGPVTHEPERLEPEHVCADMTKAKELLDFESEISLEDGISELKEFLKN